MPVRAIPDPVFGSMFVKGDDFPGLSKLVKALAASAIGAMARAAEQGADAEVCFDSGIALGPLVITSIAVNHPEWVKALYDSLSEDMRLRIDLSAENLLAYLPLGDS